MTDAPVTLAPMRSLHVPAPWPSWWPSIKGRLLTPLWLPGSFTWPVWRFRWPWRLAPEGPRQLVIWLRAAYEDATSKEHAALLEWLLALVVVSVVLTVAEQDEVLAGRFAWAFGAADAMVAAGLAADVALHLIFSKQRRQYLRSGGCVIDVLAILPSLHLFVSGHAIKVLRGVRLIRVFRALRLAHGLRHQPLASDEFVPERTALPLEVAVVCIAPPLILVPSDPLRNLLLLCLLGGALSIGIRLTLTRRQRDRLAVLVLILTILIGVAGAVLADRLVGADEAVTLLLVAVAVVGVSWLRIEAPARAL